MFSDTRYEAESRRIVSDLDATMLGGGGFEADLAMEEWVPLGDKESTPSWISLPIQKKVSRVYHVRILRGLARGERTSGNA